ncbi:MAG: ribonuclease HII, partial [Vallitaleaceae bacterium]|nr:ribonuclease HII [Vallitaleaceae bacterium]
METNTDIKNKLTHIEIDHILSALVPYKSDERAGVIKLVTKYENKYRDYLKELERIERLKRYEHKYDQYLYICGIDEVGRGPLCGPVVAGAVILPKDTTILYIDDSKKLSEQKRELLYDEIMEQAIAVGVGYGSVDLIEEVNILNATKIAMVEAIKALGIVPDMILVDAVTIPNIRITQESIIQGDTKSISIA